MTLPDPRGPRSAGVSRILAVVLATVGFFALAVFGLGALSIATDTDIIATPGLGQVPGAAGMLMGVVVFALVLAASLRRDRPSFASSPAVALAAALAHLVAVWIGAAASGDAIVATATVGGLVQGGASVVILAAGAIAAWAGIALRRTHASRPRWPWEQDDEE